MQKTKIEYLDYTWNPIAMRCTPVTEGCKNCWHLTMANRLAHNSNIDQERRSAYAGGLEVLVEKELAAPGLIKKPSRIGVQFMGDLFHEKVSDDMLLQVFNVIRANIQHHKFIILTKRPDRMADIIPKVHFDNSGDGRMWITKDESDRHDGYPIFGTSWHRPSFNGLWLGLSISTNADLWMVDKLLEIPAAVRFVSVEPMLERSDLICNLKDPYVQNRIDWVICGAETGHGKRPFDIEWARDLRTQCKMVHTPFFFKQDGEGNNTIDGIEYREYPDVNL